MWNAPGDGGSVILTARSTDGAATFGAATTVPGSAAPGNRGWTSIATTGNGRTSVLWLDHRDTARPGATGDGAHAHHMPAPPAAPSRASGVARAQQSQLYLGLSSEGSPRPVTRGVCYCCKTALIATPGGGLAAAWRHVYEDHHRDIAFAFAADGRTFQAPVRISRDGWALDGCPENGPALAVDAAGLVHAVWPTRVRTAAGTESLGLFHASTPDGRVFTPRQALPTTGTAYHPAMSATAGNGLVVA